MGLYAYLRPTLPVPCGRAPGVAARWGEHRRLRLGRRPALCARTHPDRSPATQPRCTEAPSNPQVYRGGRHAAAGTACPRTRRRCKRLAQAFADALHQARPARRARRAQRAACALPVWSAGAARTVAPRTQRGRAAATRLRFRPAAAWLNAQGPVRMPLQGQDRRRAPTHRAPLHLMPVCQLMLL